MEFAKLVLRCLLLVAGFGGVLGAVSALVSPEVFTLGRPGAFGDLPAPVLGMLWGCLEFMMPGAVVGLAVAMAANVGERPAIKAMFYRKPLWAHLLFIAAIAAIAGVLGWSAVQNGHWEILGPLAAAVPPERHAAIGAVWWASRGAHLANLMGGIALAVWTWQKRREFEAIVMGTTAP